MHRLRSVIPHENSSFGNRWGLDFIRDTLPVGGTDCLGEKCNAIEAACMSCVGGARNVSWSR